MGDEEAQPTTPFANLTEESDFEDYSSDVLEGFEEVYRSVGDMPEVGHADQPAPSQQPSRSNDVGAIPGESRSAAYAREKRLLWANVQDLIDTYLEMLARYEPQRSASARRERTPPEDTPRAKARRRGPNHDL